MAVRERLALDPESGALFVFASKRAAFTAANAAASPRGRDRRGNPSSGKCTGRELNPYAFRRRNLKPSLPSTILRTSRKQARSAIRVGPKSGVFTRLWGNGGAIPAPSEAAKTRLMER
ncbi:MAG: hypothetical protein ACRENE_34775 [Polyangiaceae bacterium]